MRKILYRPFKTPHVYDDNNDRYNIIFTKGVFSMQNNPKPFGYHDHDKDDPIDLRTSPTGSVSGQESSPAHTLPPSHEHDYYSPQSNGPRPMARPYMPAAGPRPKSRTPLVLLLGVAFLVVLLCGLAVGAGFVNYVSRHNDHFNYAITSAEEIVRNELTKRFDSGSYNFDFGTSDGQIASSQTWITRENDWDSLMVDKQFAAHEVQEIYVDLEATRIQFFPSDTNDIRVFWYTNMPDTEQNRTVNRSNGTLVIKEEPKSILNIFTNISSYIEVYMPVDTTLDYRIKGVSGDIGFNVNAVLANNFTVETISGDIFLADLNASGDINIQTKSGSVSAGQLKGANFSFHSMSGSYCGNGIVSPDIQAETISGGFNPTYMGTQYAKIQTVSGEISIDTTKAQKVDATTTSGHMFFGSINAPELDLDSVSGDIEIQDGTFDNMSVDTVSGNTYLWNTMDPINVKIHTISGNIIDSRGLVTDSANRRIVFNSVSGSIYIQ